jgi:hypothetical protein
MWQRFVRWYFGQATYPWIVVMALLATLSIVSGVLSITRDDGSGWVLLGGGVLLFAKAAADLVYRIHHQPKARPVPPTS